SARAAHLQARLAAGTLNTEGLDEAALLLGHEYGSAVGTAKGEIGRLLSAQGYLAFERSIGCDNGDLAGRKPREIDAAVDVSTHAVVVDIRKTCDQPGVVQFTAVKAIGPDLPRVRFADVKRRAVRAQIDPVGHAE